LNIYETGSCTVFPANPDLSGVPKKINFTNLGNKQKFQELKYNLKSELSHSEQTGVPLFACVGHITVSPLRYKGSQVYHRTISIEDAIEQTRAQARRHL
jgi:hypothetical protein